MRTETQRAIRYRKKAERLRTLAVELPEARAALLEVADGYDKMAAEVAGILQPASTRTAPRTNRAKSKA
jgi:hypothetical protein